MAAAAVRFFLLAAPAPAMLAAMCLFGRNSGAPSLLAWLRRGGGEASGQRQSPVKSLKYGPSGDLSYVVTNVKNHSTFRHYCR